MSQEMDLAAGELALFQLEGQPHRLETSHHQIQVQQVFVERASCNNYIIYVTQNMIWVQTRQYTFHGALLGLGAVLQSHWYDRPSKLAHALNGERCFRYVICAKRLLPKTPQHIT